MTVGELQRTDSDSRSAPPRVSVDLAEGAENEFEVHEEWEEAAISFTTAEGGLDHFVDEERSYVENGLRICMESYILRLEAHQKRNVKRTSPILESKEMMEIFGSFRLVYRFNRQLVNALSQAQKYGHAYMLEHFGNIISHFVPYLKVYQQYNSTFADRIRRLNQIEESNVPFQQFCAVNRAIFGKSLEYFLSLPVRRLPNYLLSMAAIYELIPNKGADAANNLGSAVFGVKKVTDEITKAIKIDNSRRLVFELNNSIFGGKLANIVLPKRYVMRHQQLKLVRPFKKPKRMKKRDFILFNDVLIIAKEQMLSKHSEIDEAYPTLDLKAREIETSKEYPGVNQVAIETMDGMIVVSCPNTSSMAKWIEMLNEAAFLEDHTPYPTNPKDLKARIQGKRTSAEGRPETILVKDPIKREATKKWEAEEFGPEEFMPVAAEDDDSSGPAAYADHASGPPTPTNANGATFSDESPPPVPTKPPGVGASVQVPPPPRRPAGPRTPPKSDFKVPPPPPPAPVAPPLVPPLPSLPPPPAPGGGALLQQIKGGVSLNRVDQAAHSLSRSSGGRDTLMRNIRGGASLRKVSTNNRHLEKSTGGANAAEAGANDHGSDGSSLVGVLAKSLAGYRKFVAVDDGSDDEEDEEWD